MAFVASSSGGDSYVPMPGMADGQVVVRPMSMLRLAKWAILLLILLFTMGSFIAVVIVAVAVKKEGVVLADEASGLGALAAMAAAAANASLSS